jgi:uncharacterized protein
MRCGARASEGVTILRETYSAWAMGDIEEMFVHFATDAVYALHVQKDVLPYGGETRGIELLIPRLRLILEMFAIIDYTPVSTTRHGDRFHTVVHYRFRHRETGLDIDGTTRHVVQIEKGKIMRFDEYHDTDRIRAFFRLLDAPGHF